MKVQLLYFPDCPNVAAARAALRRAFSKSGIQPAFEEIDVTATTTPESLRDWGSPTILVNGMDIGGERTPTGPCCRLYDAIGTSRGVPDDEKISALLRAKRRGWLRALAGLPGALCALLPSATCLACLAGYAGVLSALGLGFLLRETLLTPLIAILLCVGIAGVAWSTRSHRRPGPLVASVVGSLVVAAGRLVWNIPALLYAGVALLVVASFWNLWLKRPKIAPLVPISTLPTRLWR